MDVPMRAARTSPCARCAEDVAPYQPAHPVPPPGRHGRMAATGTFVVGADVLGGPRPPGRPHACSADVPCARRAEDVAPYQPAHPGPPSGRHGRMAATGTFVVGADVPGGPRPRDVPMRAARTSPCARRAEDVAPYQPAHPGPPAGAARAHGGHGGVCGRGRRPRRPVSPERPHARSAGVPCAQRARPPARGAPRTSRPTSRRIPFPRRGGTGAWRSRGHLW